MARRKTDAEFKAEVKELVGNEYTFLEEYSKSNHKLKVRHNTCGNEYAVLPGNFLNGRRCPKCSYKERNKPFKKTDVTFRQEVKDLEGGDYTFLDEYDGAHTKLRVIHNVCGSSYAVAPTDFLSGYRCPHCAKVYRPNQGDVIKRIKELVGDEYVLKSAYVNNATKVRIQHMLCGLEYEVVPYAFWDGNRCPRCSTRVSKGERTVREALSHIGEPFEEQKLIGGRLRADFYLPEHQAFIEYDGIQHFTPVDHFGGIPYLYEVQAKDEIKNKYWEWLGFPYLRIPYWELNKVEEVIGNFIQELKNNKEEND